MSNPLSAQNHVAAVIGSCRLYAHLMEVAPLPYGRGEGWKMSVPYFGVLSCSVGTFSVSNGAIARSHSWFVSSLIVCPLARSRRCAVL